MMERPESPTDSILASLRNHLAGSNDGSSPSRALTGGSLGIVLLSVVASITAYVVLPEQMRIHWTLGMGPYYGPEVAPTLLVLSLFPVLISGVAAIAAAADALLGDTAELATIHPYYIVAMLGTLSLLLGSQIALIVANL